MQPWDYGHIARLATIEAVRLSHCMFCGFPMDTISKKNWEEVVEEERERSHFGDAGRVIIGAGRWQYFDGVRMCSRCGWWSSERNVSGHQEDHGKIRVEYSVLGCAGCLKALDLTDVSVPVEEVRTHLIRKYDSRFDLNPRHFENVVASVFQSVGYTAVVTNYSGDDGIDVFLRKDGEEIGVQVRRYRDSIDVSQIRELSGSLLLGGLSRGIFVTTSKFQSGGRDTANRYAMRGQLIELVDEKGFYEILEIAQRADSANWHERILELAEQNRVPLLSESRKTLI